MPAIARDPLLTVARYLLIFIMGMMALVGIIMVIGAPALLVFREAAAAEIAKEGIANAATIIPMIAALLAVLGVFMGFGIWFLMLLYRIIGSVGEGDPFVPINADRLSRMGWIAVAVQLTMLPVAGMILWLEERIGDAHGKVHFDGDINLDPMGILLILILFILARVFRQGAAMREDLEGTV